jgi:hypothetical protein
MSEIEYVNASQWAAECGVSKQRVNQVLRRVTPPGVLRIRRSKTWTYAIPTGTPWPKGQPAHPMLNLPGYIAAKEWAGKVGKTIDAVYSMFHTHGAPKGTIRDGWHYFIPENAEWSYPKPGNPFGRRGRPKGI